MVGALLLLVLDPGLFRAIVPVLILVGLVLVVTGPRLNAWAERRRAEGTGSAASHERAMQGGVFGAGVYGGYFGAAQGIILMGILGALSSEPIQRLNGYKNVLATIVNGVAAVVFIVVAPDRIDWLVVLLIAIGSTIGGVIGSTVGRRLPPPVLRGVIVVIGLVAVVKLARVPLMDWLLVVGLGLAVLAGGVVQSTIGFGLAVVAAPVVVLLAPDLMPVALLVPAFTLPLLQLSHGVRDITWHPLGWALAARSAVHAGRGGRGGDLLATGDRRPRRGADPGDRRPVGADDRPSGHPRNAAVAGAVTGISGTAAAIGGPFLALVLQHERPKRVRSTLAVFFVAGSLLGLRAWPSVAS